MDWLHMHEANAHSLAQKTMQGTAPSQRHQDNVPEPRHEHVLCVVVQSNRSDERKSTRRRKRVYTISEATENLS